jgi:hypothetical protein
MIRMVLAATAILAACSKESRPTPPPEQVDRGREAVATLKKQLVAALEAALQKGGADAIETCSVEAPRIAAAIGDGVRVGRMTRKPRNPDNAVRGWQEEALAGFEKRIAEGLDPTRLSFSRVLDGGTVGYAEPLVIQPLCTTCHGDAIAPEIAAALRARYPDDQATGYRPGDLRGLAWAEIDQPSP